MDENTIKCPKCGHENNSSFTDCANCGITYALYIESKEKKKEAEKKKKEKKSPEPEQDLTVKCPQCGHENTSPEACFKCGVVFSKYFEIQEKLLKETLNDHEALKNLKEEKERIEALKKQQEEKERIEALKKQAEDEKKIEEIRKKKEEHEKAMALKKQKEEEEKLRKQKEEEEKLRKQKEEEEAREQKTIKALKSGTKIKDLLNKYEGRIIGVNYDDPQTIKEAKLIGAGEDYFSIFLAETGLLYSYPLKNIISVVEGLDGIGDAVEKKSSFSIAIRVYQ